MWRRSSRESILAMIFGVASGVVAVSLYVNDPRHTAGLLALVGGFSALVLFAWAVTSHNAVVAMFEGGLRVGWLGLRTHFVPWEEVTRVEDEVRRRVARYGLSIYDVSEVLHVHCRGEVHSIGNRLVSGKSFQQARRVLREHVRADCFASTASGFEPPSRARVALGAVILSLSGILVLVLAIGATRDAWSAYRGWTQWPHVTATVIHDDVPPGASAPHAVLQYSVDGRSQTRTVSVATTSADLDVGAHVDQAVDTRDASRGVTRREMNMKVQNAAVLSALFAFYAVMLVTVARNRARRRQQQQRSS